MSAKTTIDASETANFSTMSADWWDANGTAAPLHRLSRPRITYIRDQVVVHFSAHRQIDLNKPFSDLSVLDLGCGAGLAAVPLAKMGANVTAVDASAEMLEAGQDYVETIYQRPLNIEWRNSSAEQLTKEKKRYDLVVSLEVIEHVTDPSMFLASAAELVAPGGLLILSTLNRTLKSRILAISVAENLLGWLPRGTHDWTKFRTIEEVSSDLALAGLTVCDVSGLVYRPLQDEFEISATDTQVNYILAACSNTIPKSTQ